MPRTKKDTKNNNNSGVLQKMDINPIIVAKKTAEPPPPETPKDKLTFRVLTLEEKEEIKKNIPLLEEHEQLQIIHFIRMDNVKHTVKQNGILCNLKNASDEFIFKIYTYINKCIENKKYRNLS